MTSWRNWPRELETNAGGETFQMTAAIVSRFSARLLPLNYDRILRTGEATGLSLQAKFLNPCRHVGMTFSKIHFPKSRFWHLYKNIPTFCRFFQMWRTWEKPWRGSSAEVKGAEFGWETIHVFRGVPASQKIAMTFFLTALIDNCAPACCTSRIFMTAVIWVERSVFKQGSSRLSSRMFKSRMRKLQNLKECTEWPSDFRSSVTVFPHST